MLYDTITPEVSAVLDRVTTRIGDPGGVAHGFYSGSKLGWEASSLRELESLIVREYLSIALMCGDVVKLPDGSSARVVRSNEYGSAATLVDLASGDEVLLLDLGQVVGRTPVTPAE